MYTTLSGSTAKRIATYWLVLFCCFIYLKKDHWLNRLRLFCYTKIDDKTGRLDVRAETKDNQQFDIEMQLTNQKNMARRTLFYLSKIYVGSIKAGGKYADLKRTVTLNIVDFNLFDISRFRTTFHFYEDHEDY